MDYETLSCTRTPTAGVDFQLFGERLQLKRLKKQDATEAYVEWLLDPEVNRFLESRFQNHSLSSVALYVEECFQSAENLLFGIFLKANGQHIGNIKVGPIDFHHLHASIGLMIGDRNEWGKGYASEAIQAVSRFCFDTLHLHHLTAGAYASNQGSLKAFERAGYEIEGRLRAHWLIQEKVSDGVLLGRVNPALIQRS
jgi:[ribosomal protein S5]-alanine N-acetyltransferase